MNPIPVVEQDVTRSPVAERLKQDSTAADLAEGALQGMIGYRLKRAYMCLRPAARQTLTSMGLRLMPFICLSVIVSNPGISPSDLSEMQSIERPNLVVIIDELVALGFVTRRPSETDRRRITLTATIKGRTIHDKAAAAIVESERTLLRHLTDAEQVHLAALLRKIEGDAES